MSAPASAAASAPRATLSGTFGEAGRSGRVAGVTVVRWTAVGPDVASRSETWACRLSPTAFPKAAASSAVPARAVIVMSKVSSGTVAVKSRGVVEPFRDPSWLMWKSEGVIVGRLLLFPVVCGVPVDVDGVVDEPEALGPGGGAPSLVPPSGFLA